MIKLSENVMLLGNGHFNHYVVGRKDAALIECGMSSGVMTFSDQWGSIEDKPVIAYVIALHSHFDHVCGIPLLRKLFPQATVMANPRTQKVLSSDKVCHSLRMGDNLVSEKYYNSGRIKQKPPELEPEYLKIDQTISEGDIIELGEGLELQIIDVPGHSPCSIAAYLKNDKIMFVSDAAGTSLNDGLIAPVFFQDYEMYLESINKIMKYNIDILAVGHGEVVIGNEKVQKHLKQAILSAEEAFAHIKQKLLGGTDEAELAQQLYATYITDGLADYPAPVMLGSMHQLIKNVKERI